jgi:excisionase family DNA binding protein
VSSPRDDLVRALGPETTALIEQLIEERVDRHRNERALLTVAEYASRTGLTERAVRARTERGQLPTVKLGRSVFIKVE